MADFMPAQREVDQVAIAKQHDDKAVLVAKFVGKKTLNFGNDGAADHQHHQNARPLAGEPAQTLQRQREDARPHHRVEQAAGDNGPHGNVSVSEDGCGNQDQRGGGDRRQRSLRTNVKQRKEDNELIRELG